MGEYIEYRSDKWNDIMDRYKALSDISKRLEELENIKDSNREYIFGFGSFPGTTLKKYNKKEIILSIISFVSEKDFEDENIRLKIFGSIVHELRHMYQYYKGELSSDINSSYDIEDEEETYYDEDVINMGNDFFKYKLKRTAELKENNIYLYQNLPNGY